MQCIRHGDTKIQAHKLKIENKLHLKMPPSETTKRSLAGFGVIETHLET